MNRHRTHSDSEPAGYAALIERYELDVVPHWHTSFVATKGGHHTEKRTGTVIETYPKPYWPGDRLGDHLEFALKYDGVNLGILSAIFDVADSGEIAAYIESKPISKYARCIWFFYEFLTGHELPLEDLKRGNYVNLLDSSRYYTVEPGTRVRRQRVNNNLLGEPSFCPVIRRTEMLRRFEESDLSTRCMQVLKRFPPDLIRRALSYLYTKETKSSFEIEHIEPSSNRTEKFVAMLHLAEREDFCEKERLIEVQNRIVDPRFAAQDYRNSQTYVGETVTWQKECIHYVCPKPEMVRDLMAGLITLHRRMEQGQVHPVAQAAAVSYGLVFIHPFQDGNGRIHRFLIHNILARRRFSPPGIMFPVSAAMLNDPAEYDASLEAFSRQIMVLVNYTLDEKGEMTVHNDIAQWYRYIDMTAQTEALFGFIEKTITTELEEELKFLENYDRTKKAIQEIVDMPDRQIDLFIRFCLQNNGRLSRRKRASYFDVLTDDEIQQMEEAVRAGYGASLK